MTDKNNSLLGGSDESEAQIAEREKESTQAGDFEQSEDPTVAQAEQNAADEFQPDDIVAVEGEPGPAGIFDVEANQTLVDTNALTAAAMNRLNAVLDKAKLTPEEYNRVQRCTARMVQIGVAIGTATEKDKTSLLEALDLDLSTLDALREEKGIDVSAAVRNAAYLTVSDYSRMGLQILAKYVIPAVVVA